jgi:hypothetical protein
MKRMTKLLLSLSIACLALLISSFALSIYSRSNEANKRAQELQAEKEQRSRELFTKQLWSEYGSHMTLGKTLMEQTYDCDTSVSKCEGMVDVTKAAIAHFEEAEKISKALGDSTEALEQKQNAQDTLVELEKAATRSPGAKMTKFMNNKETMFNKLSEAVDKYNRK